LAGRYAQSWTMAEVRPGRNGGLCRLRAPPGRRQAGCRLGGCRFGGCRFGGWRLGGLQAWREHC